MRTVRVPLLPAQRGFVRRMGCYLSFASAAALWGPILCRRPDVLWVESPPLFVGSAAWVLSAFWRCPYVLNVSDLWPESAIRLEIVREGVATRLAQGMEHWMYRTAAGVTGQSEEIVEWVRARAPTTPTCLITNGVDPDRFGEAKSDAEARSLLGSYINN